MPAPAAASAAPRSARRRGSAYGAMTSAPNIAPTARCNQLPACGSPSMASSASATCTITA